MCYSRFTLGMAVAFAVFCPHVAAEQAPNQTSCSSWPTISAGATSAGTAASPRRRTWTDSFANGVELDQHYVQPVCTPTRTALMSGRYPGRFGPHALAPSNLRAMPLGTVTLASALKSLGYYTCQSGKWHLGSRPEWGPDRIRLRPRLRHADRRRRSVDAQVPPGQPLRGHLAPRRQARLTRRATPPSWSPPRPCGGSRKRSPWFVYVPFHAVHTPVDAPRGVQEAVRRREISRRPGEARLAAAAGGDGLAARRQGRTSSSPRWKRPASGTTR